MSKQEDKRNLQARVTILAAYVLMNGGIVLIVRSFPGLFLCPMSALSGNVIDFNLCFSTSQQVLNAFFTTLKTEPAILAGYTSISIVAQQAFWYISKQVRAAKLVIK